MRDQLDRIKFLEETHRKLDNDIQKGYSNFLGDQDLSKMKLQKLRLKEQIEQMKKEVEPVDVQTST